MKSSVDQKLPVYHMTLMPTLMRGFIACNEINEATFICGGKYSNQTKVLQIPCSMTQGGIIQHKTALYDKENDPQQQHPITELSIIKLMDEKLKNAMLRVDAPNWQFDRMGFKK